MAGQGIESTGQLASIEDHVSNRITVYTYDPSGRMIGSYEYRSSESLSRHHAHYVYDDLSRLTEVYQTVNYKVGSLESYEDEIRVRYEYNRAGALARVFYTTGAYTAGTQLLYDEFFRITSKDQTFGIGGTTLFRISASYTYVNVSGRGTTPMVESYTSCVKTEGGQTLSNTTYRYTYDSNGNITAIRDASNAVIAQYTYDSLGQLTQEINVPLGRRYVWTYDDAGNILSKKTYNKNSGALIETQNYTYTTGSWGDLLTQIGSNTIEYDSIGNPTMWGREEDGIWYDGALLEWKGRELQRYQAFRENGDGYLDADYAIYFTYNADGIRTEKNTDLGNHEYILNGDQIVGEWIGGRTTLIVYLYDEAGTPIGMKIRQYTQAEGVFDEYFFEKNLQGDIIAVYNMDGEKIGTYTYDAWGNFTVTLASTNTSAENEIVNTYNPFRYRGYYYDVETGLYYLQSRYYNPAWGRFINADGYVSTGQGLLGNNMFAYCGNNPTMNVDFSGDFFKEFLDGVQSVIDEVKEVVDYCFTDLLFAIGDALIVDIGVGHGIAGAKEVDGISVEAVARMDMITVRKDAGNNTRFYVGKAKETYVSVEGMHSVFEKGTKEFYSLDDELLYSIPVEPHYDLTTSYSVKGYSPLIGITFEVGIDINYLVSRLTNGEVILWKG